MPIGDGCFAGVSDSREWKNRFPLSRQRSIPNPSGTHWRATPLTTTACEWCDSSTQQVYHPLNAGHEEN